MATTTVYTYRCPRCRTDIGRQFGLLTKLSIVCPTCATNVRIDSNVIMQNWGYNFAWVGGLVLWLALGLGVLADQDFAATIGRETFPADTFNHRVVIAGVCVVPALLGGLLIGGVGMLLGAIVAAGASSDSASISDPPPSPTPGQWPPGGSWYPAGPGQQRWQTPGAGYPPAMNPPTSPQPPQRSLFVRAFFVLLWPVVFFIGAGLVLTMAAVSGVKSDEPLPAVGASTVGLIGSPLGQGPLLAATSLVPQDARDEQMQQHATEQMAEKAAPWLLLGMLMVFGLGCAGFLPVTGRKKNKTAAQSGLSGPEQTPVGRLDFPNYPTGAAPEPRPRNILVRGFFVLLWPIVFFFAAAFTMAALAGGFSAENEQLRKQIFEHSAHAHVGWILLVSLVLFIVGCLGFLPGTGSKKKSRAAVQADPGYPRPA